MPIYEYECTKCGCIVEAWQKFSDPALTTCNKCSGRLHKLISQSAFHLKGTGWYVTDYAKKSRNTPTSSEAREKKPEETETKPDTKSSPSKKED